MNTSFNFLFFISTFLIISIQPFLSAQPTCPSLMPYACSTTGPEIKFPFWLKASYDLCTYPGFEVSCNNKSQTIINLPTSGDFIVKRIDYLNKAIYINDETSCLPNRMRNFTLSDTPFKPSNLRRYKFVNCSSNWTDDLGSNIYHPFTISCLSGKNHSVYAVSSRIPNQELPSYCYEIDTNSSQWFVSRYWLPMVMVGELRLVWNDPRCYSCAAQRLTCRVSDNDEVVCVSPSRNGIPRTAKYGIIVGVGIPAFLLILAIMGYTCGRIKAQDIRRRLDNELSDTITLQPVITITGGLDGRTIESYPKTELGESGRLPKPNDVTCPICLCEYQPKETLRSIPECNHYFHVNCIDEWLKLNGTCPLCRNSPESLSSFPIASSISTTTS